MVDEKNAWFFLSEQIVQMVSDMTSANVFGISMSKVSEQKAVGISEAKNQQKTRIKIYLSYDKSCWSGDDTSGWLDCQKICFWYE